MSFLFPSQTITFEAAMRDIATGSAKARALAAHALGDVTEPTEKRRAVEALVVAVEDDRVEVRVEACSSLGDLGDPIAIPALVKRLDDGIDVVRQSAAIALGAIGHSDAFDALVTALREGPADVRYQAATSLAEIDPQRAFDPISAALRDRDPQVVSAAALSLGAIPGDDTDLKARARTALLEELDQPSDATRFDVAYALAQLGEGAGRSLLARALTDPERAWDAVTALATLGSPADITALSNALTERKVPPEATVLAAGAVLRTTNGPDGEPARRVLLAGLAARKIQVRGLAVEQLGEVGRDWAVEPLEKLARSGKGVDLLEAIATSLRAIAARGK